MTREQQPIQMAVVGDIHEQWEGEDGKALKQLGVDLVLFVGDFGNEAVDVVRSIAALDLPKAAILGNHDAWYSASDWGRKKCPYDRTKEDRVQQQLELLGKAHVGYGSLDFPHLNLSVVGSRPFSWGGSQWKNRGFYRDRYQVNGFAESTEKIVAAARQTAYDTIIFIGHNGPTGLGDTPESACGKDWKPIGGDYGDPDFAEAIASVRATGKKVPLVTFGHMHHRLRHTSAELRQALQHKAGTVYLNAARVPRIIELEGERYRNFSLVSLHNSTIKQVSLVWVNEVGQIAREEILYQPQELVAQSVPGQS
ncbi:MAG: TIGR04168 family protein [Cyanophyceae cyanobacterium]